MAHDLSPSERRIVRRIECWFWLVIAAIVVFAAIMSYRHIRDLARDHGETGLNATLLPLIVESIMIAAALVFLRNHFLGVKLSRALPTFAFMLGAFGSLGANVLHSEPSTIARVIGAWPAIILIIGWELIAYVIKHKVPARDTTRDHVTRRDVVTRDHVTRRAPVTRPEAVTHDHVTPAVALPEAETPRAIGRDTATGPVTPLELSGDTRTKDSVTATADAVTAASGAVTAEHAGMTEDRDTTADHVTEDRDMTQDRVSPGGTVTRIDDSARKRDNAQGIAEREGVSLRTAYRRLAAREAGTGT